MFLLLPSCPVLGLEKERRELYLVSSRGEGGGVITEEVVIWWESL